MPKLGRRSEFTELDHLRVAALTTSNAPFGTYDTPSFKPRIIGGNMVNVIERPANTNLPKYEKLSLISDKPNNIDPRALNDFNRRYNQPYREGPSSRDSSPLRQTEQHAPPRYEEDPFNQRTQPSRPPAFVSKRPDSKDISRRYPTLAPIDGNRIKNHQMSTVFEPEAWTRRYHKDDSSSIASRHNGFPTSPLMHETRNYNPPSTGSTAANSVTDEQFKSRLLAQIPRGVFLPDSPLVLTERDEMRLLSILAWELRPADPVKLRDVYLDITNTVDKQLFGYCGYQDLFHTLSRMNFQFPADLLQIVAALFVSDHRNQRDVNYEKFLSFVGVALKNKNTTKPSNTGNQYYTSNSNNQRKHSPIRHRPGSPFFNDGGEAKLFRMIEEQLNENEYVIDFEKLIHSFQQEDRDVRGTLSADQIKGICFHHRIPIQESLIANMLQRCEDSNRDEQYKWWDFVRLLERVQPAKTGLTIPTSKRPLEYAKVQPAPAPSWPKGSNSYTPSWKMDPPISPRKEEVPDPNREIISRMDQELRDLERNYEELKSKSPRRKEEAPWFKNFMAFADALYRQDERYEGSLPYSDVAEWTRMYNDSFQLDIPENVISTALNQSTKKGKLSGVDVGYLRSVLSSEPVTN
ncbi:hypothetical protein RRG08_032225 [Elysia crispata]|uniref:DUF5580 domain-containing protein n=1 Tax=Elysia crispata TaxID=231223 RepID=A0AAE1E773_9GAST|nr:hypothetical protein RRG08_032225 [Elysia crispata]